MPPIAPAPQIRICAAPSRLRATAAASVESAPTYALAAIPIAEGLAAQGITVDKRKIILADPIKLIGEYDVAVRLHHDVTGTVKVVEGGLEIFNDAGTGSTVIAHAGAIVRLDIV